MSCFAPNDTTQLVTANDMSVGQYLMITSVTKQNPTRRMDPKRHVELRATQRTNVHPCPEAIISDMLKDTPATEEDAILWSPPFRPRERTDFEAANATWMTLSVLEKAMKSPEPRTIDKLFQVPSVFITLGGSVTYMACATCMRSWNGCLEEAPCDC